MSDKFQLAKRRDIGDIIQDAIKLLSHSSSQALWRNILVFVLPTYIVSGFFLGQFQLDMKDILPNLQSGQITSMEEAIEAMSKIFGFHYYMLLLFSVIGSSLLGAFVYNFLSISYHNPSRAVDADELRSNSLPDIGWIIGFHMLTGLITSLGILLFIIPGIYLAVATSLLVIAAKVENLSFGEAFRRSRTLVQDNWWNTFLVIIVIGLLIGICNSVLGNVFTVIFTAIDAERGVILSSVFQNAISGVLAVFSTIAISFQYFNLITKREGETDVYEDIEEIGKP